MKKVLLALLCLLFVGTNVFADTKFLYDNANLLSEQDQQSLEQELTEASDSMNLNIVIVTVDEDIDDSHIREYADNKYDELFGKSDGIEFLINMKNRNFYVSTVEGVIDKISDEKIDNIMNDYVYGDLANGNYYNAFKGFVKGFKYYYEKEDPIPEPVKKDYKFGVKNLIISGGVAGVVSLIVFLVFNGQLKSVKKKKVAHEYIDQNSFVLTGYSDFLINRHVSKSPIVRNDSGGHGGGGSHSSHVSSSGVSHGGHGGHF